MDDCISGWLNMLKSSLFQPFFIVSILLYVAVHVVRACGFHLPEIVNSYLTDLLCMPIVLTLSSLGVRIIKRNPSINLSLSMVLSLTLFYALYFEWFLPLRSQNYTVDWIDVCCYFAGSIIYFVIIQPKYLQEVLAEN